MKQLLIKVCGMRDESNIRDLQQLDIDWMGMIFFEKSPRHVSKPISTPKKRVRVGVFVNENAAKIQKIAQAFDLDLLQLHGEESPAFCQHLKSKGFKIIKVFSVGDGFDFSITTPYADVVDYFLFDTKGKNRGGNGVAFDWDILKKYTGKTPFLLSGGIDENSAAAIRHIQHAKMVGIDINSRFETSPAVKNIQRIKQFIHELRSK